MNKETQKWLRSKRTSELFVLLREHQRVNSHLVAYILAELKRRKIKGYR